MTLECSNKEFATAKIHLLRLLQSNRIQKQMSNLLYQFPRFLVQEVKLLAAEQNFQYL